MSGRKEQLMAYVIALPCLGVKDGACVAVCPMDCIHPRPDSPEYWKHGQMFIDPDACIDCHMCAEECPVNAIFHELEVPEEWKAFIKKNASHFQNQKVG
jgi:NAD-dependent dihydropyrimidine dehydrogenase PreA subunit